MIKLLKSGNYKMTVQKDEHKIIVLDNQGYHWDTAKGIGEILTLCKTPHKEDHTLVQGNFKLFEVKNEPKLVDLQHLELSVGKNKWQGYLLLTGLPNKNKLRSRIIATKELIKNVTSKKK